MANLRDKMSSDVAAIVLRYVRNKKGRLTQVSDDCRINRREFNISGLNKMRLHRLLRIVYDLYLELPYSEFVKMTDEIRDIIKDYGDEYDYTLLDEL